MNSDEKCGIDNLIYETNKEIQKLQEHMDMLQEKVSHAKLAKENKDCLNFGFSGQIARS